MPFGRIWRREVRYMIMPGPFPLIPAPCPVFSLHTHTLTHLHTCLVLDDRLYFGRTMSLIYSEEICGMCNRSWYRAHSAIGTGSHFISYAK